MFPLLSIIAIGGSRLSGRLWIERRESGAIRLQQGRTVLIVGAGDAAEDLIRELRQNPRFAYRIAGIVDDDPNKRSQRIHGVEVLGNVEAIPDLVKALGVEEILIAIPSAGGAQMRRIVEHCRAAAVSYRTVPGLGDILEGKVHVRHLRRVRSSTSGCAPARSSTRS